MDGSFVHVLGAASIGAAIAAAGAAVLVIRVVLGHTLSREIDEEYRNRHRC